MNKKRTISLLCLFICVLGYAQEFRKLTLSGSIQSDILLPQNDSKTGAVKTEDLQSNTYADLRLQSQHVDAGLRLEYLEHPLPGYEKDFKGWGFPHFWVKGKLKDIELTVGTFYEQFGSGFVLRTYEERSLGIDNSLLGGRLQAKPWDGVTFKLLSGCQRRYWDWNKSLISGADLEVDISRFSPKLQEKGMIVLLGGSWVNRYEKPEEKIYTDATHYVNFPKFVNVWDIRSSFDYQNWNILVEYTRKSEDPSFANGYIFRQGSAAMLSSSYSSNGLSLLVQARRSENMSFKSTNEVSKAIGISSAINHLPAFTQDHTYALAALYPYATQLANGEWAYQAELGYNFKRKTTLGGKYGMNVKVNFSYIRSIDRQFYDSSNDPLAATDGYSSSFFKWGDDTYYQDLDIMVTRKLSKDFRLCLMYMNQRYNKTVVEGEGGMIHSDIFIVDGKYQLSPKTTLRGEVQYLATKDDQGDWAYGLLELSLVPHWMITLSDIYNVGETHIHYYQGLVTCHVGQHRIQAGYGRTRAGFNCSGGVCRWIPATTGFTVSYNYNF